MHRPTGPIGIYDSGVGGLSVLREVRGLLPAEDLIYVGDQAHVPYGLRDMQEIQQLTEGVTRFLLDQDCKLIVIACNTASAAGLKLMREKYPQVPFVGMEPAVKPAAEQTHSGKVGVLATPTTFSGQLYASVVERFAHDVQLFTSTSPGLVAQIEKGNLDTPKTRKILEQALLPMLQEGVDTLVMGCTHYPFVIPAIERITAGKARVIDPAPAVARQVQRVLGQQNLLKPAMQPGTARFFTSGDPRRFSGLIRHLIGMEAEAQALRWEGTTLSVLP
ncbi:MAG: glutamate racemase [Anaerolineaceae bacterium]|jgi:glutamate racemase